MAEDVYVQMQKLKQLRDDMRAYGGFDAPKLFDPGTATREAALGSLLIIGATGSGKTTLTLYSLLDRWENMRIPRLNINEMKIIVLDVMKCEAGAMFCPMKEGHPMYKTLGMERRQPRGYPVEIYRPLTIGGFMEGQPDIFPEVQPTIVKPFTFATDSLFMTDWVHLLSLGDNLAQKSLHAAVIRTLVRDNRLSTSTIWDFVPLANKLALEGSFGFSSYYAGEALGDPIKTEKAFTKKELTGLLQRYESLAQRGFVLPKEFAGQKTPYLDFRRLLSDTKTISVFHIPQFTQDPSLHARILTVIVDRIINEKRMDNPDRPRAPVTIGIPEIANFAKKIPSTEERDYLIPLRNVVETLVRQGMGMGLSVIGDSQLIKGDAGLHPTIVENMLGLAIFNLSKDSVKELLRNRNIRNKSIFDDYQFSLLKKSSGNFIYIAPNSTYAQPMRGAVPSFFYPRTRLGKKSTETSYLELYRRMYPYYKNQEMYFSVRPLYDLARQIVLVSQNRAAKVAEVQMRKPEKEKKPKAISEEMRAGLLRLVGTKEGAVVKIGTNELQQITQAANVYVFMGKMRKLGLCIVDKEMGKKTAVIEMDKVKKLLQEQPQMELESQGEEETEEKKPPDSPDMQEGRV